MTVSSKVLPTAPDAESSQKPSIYRLQKFTDGQLRSYEKHVRLRSVDPGGKKPTPARMAYELILESKDHSRLFFSLVMLILMSFCAGSLGASSTCLVAQAFGGGCFFVCAMASVGLYGWKRVPNDLLNDLDGLDTPGQNLLEIFFHGTWIAMSLVVLSTGSVLLSTHAETVCTSSTDLDYAKAGVYLGFVMIPVAAFAMLLSLRIVTWYIIIQSLQELCCLWMLLGAMFIMVAALMMNNRVAFLSATINVSGNSTSWIAVAAIWGIIAAAVSIYGFFAGWIENKKMLGIHGGLSSVMALFALVSFIGLAAHTYDEEVASDEQCANVLKLMGRSWFEDYFSCEKYIPLNGITELNPPVCERITTNSTTSKMLTTVSWETIEMNNSIADTCLIGCVDSACCESVSAALYTFRTLIAGGGMWYMTILFVGLGATLDLHREIKHDGKVLHHPRSAKVAVVMVIVALIGIGIGLATKLGNEITIMQESSRAEVCDFLIEQNISVGPGLASCNNNILDGEELEIDCGGGTCPACDARNESALTSAPTLVPTSNSPSISSAAPTMNPTLNPTDLPSTSPTEGPTTLSPTTSPTFANASSISVRLVWNDGFVCTATNASACGAPADLDLKVRFNASDTKTCTVSSIADVNSKCGSARHLGDANFDSGYVNETIHLDQMASSLYVFYIENRLLDWPIELSKATLYVYDADILIGTFALPEADSSMYDLLGFTETFSSIEETLEASGTRSTDYSFARMVCLDGSASPPTVFACPQYFLSTEEHRVHQCEVGLTCTDCSPQTWYWDLDGDSFGDASSSTVSTCQSPDADMNLVRNGADCDDEEITVGNCTGSGSAYGAGWYIDPYERSQVARSCDNVCATFDLSCQTEEMAEITDLDSCLEKTRIALQRWCSPQDVIYNKTDSGLPKLGGIFQMSGENGRANCACKKGILQGLDGYTGTSNFFFGDNDIILQGDIFAVEEMRTESWTDPGAACRNSDANVSVTGDVVDLTTVGSYKIIYSCCIDGDCAERWRFITVNDPADDECTGFFEDLTGNKVTTEMGGCKLASPIYSRMNNVFVGFPFSTELAYYGSKNGIYASACSQKPDYKLDRRVCYCA